MTISGTCTANLFASVEWNTKEEIVQMMMQMYLETTAIWIQNGLYELNFGGLLHDRRIEKAYINRMKSRDHMLSEQLEALVQYRLLKIKVL